MFKLIFEFLIEPLGLPVAWHWEYSILAIIGFTAYIIAYRKVGDMYRANYISGSAAGSFFHWLIRLFAFVIMWAAIYGVIWLAKQIIANWQMILIIIVGSIGTIGICALVIFILRKVRKSKAVSKDA